LGAALRGLDAAFSADAEIAARTRNPTISNPTAYAWRWDCTPRRRDPEDRKVHRWARHDHPFDWVDAGRTFGGIGEADRGGRIEPRAGFGGSELGRSAGGSLPRGL